MATSLKALDDAYAKESNIQAELVRLRAVEADFIASDDCKPAELVQQRAKIGLAAGKLDRAHKVVLIAEETAVLDAEKASVLISQYKQSAVAAHFDRVQARTAEFFDKQDFGMLKALAHRSPTAIQLVNADELLFNPRTPSFRAHDLVEARRISLSFAAIEEASATLDFVVDLPHTGWIKALLLPLEKGLKL